MLFHLEQTSIELSNVIEINRVGDRATILTTNGDTYETADIEGIGRATGEWYRLGWRSLNPSKVVSIDWLNGYANMILITGALIEVKGRDLDELQVQCGKVQPFIPIVEEVEIQTVAIAKLNLNTATQSELVSLPTIGTATAKRIIASRPYQDLQQVKERHPAIDWEIVSDLVAVQ